MPNKILREMDKRSLHAAAAENVDTYPWLELVYKWKTLTKQGVPDNFFKKRNQQLQAIILNKYAPPKIFIGFDTSSEYVFEKWKGKALLVLDLTIAVPQFKRRLALDYQLPDGALQNLTKGDEAWYETYKKEVELADFVLCGSEFVKQSCLYLGAVEEKLHVIPYGANLEKFIPLRTPEQKPERPFKIAFVGNVSYRKGADVLLKVWERLVKDYEDIELHFFGNLLIDVQQYSQKSVFFHGFVTQSELIQNLNDFHVSILPTFFEGSSYAIYQSMALGLAVITTPNCGSVITNMKNGVLIEYGSESQIYDALSLLIKDKDTRIQLSETAMNDIKQYTWNDYGMKLKRFINSL